MVVIDASSVILVILMTYDLRFGLGTVVGGQVLLMPGSLRKISVAVREPVPEHTARLIPQRHHAMVIEVG